MTKKNNNLINEGVVRRWGKLANLSTLTESFIDTLTEEEGMEEEEGAEVEVEVPELEDDAGEPAADDLDVEMEAPAEEPSLDLDEDQVEQIAQVFFDTLSQVTDGEVEFEVTSSEEPADDAALDAEAMLDEEPPAMMDEEPPAPAMYEESIEGVEVVDDEELTESVLARVVERLLKNK